jgi:hypothetical protein
MIASLENKAKAKRIIRVYKLLRSQLKKYGRFISFPKKTDPSKTYIWRYISKFIDNYDQIGLEDDEMPGIVEAVVQEAKKTGLLRCGASVIIKVDLLAVCNKKFENDNNEENKTIKSVRCTHAFLQDKCDGNITVEKLIYKPSKRSYTNMIRWYQSGEIDTGYLIMSRTCRRAIKELDEDEKALLPNIRNTISIRTRLQCRERIMEALHKILGTDLLEA